MKKSIQFLACLFLFTSLLQAQQNSHKSCSCVSLDRTIEFTGSSDQETIIVDVSENTSGMQLTIDSTIESGMLTIELYDPKGNKKGNFSVESQIKSNNKRKELVYGQMQKHVDEPIKGKWSILLIPNKVVGKVAISTSMYDE